MKLVDLDTGKEIIPDQDGKIVIKRTYPNGVKAGQKFKVGELIAPSPENDNKGLVKSVREKDGCKGWVQHYPEVFNARIVV